FIKNWRAGQNVAQLQKAQKVLDAALKARNVALDKIIAQEAKSAPNIINFLRGSDPEAFTRIRSFMGATEQAAKQVGQIEVEQAGQTAARMGGKAAEEAVPQLAEQTAKVGIRTWI